MCFNLLKYSLINVLYCCILYPIKYIMTHLSHLQARRAYCIDILFCYCCIVYPALVYRDKSTYPIPGYCLMHRVGFEPTKLYAWHLKCHPFDHSGIDAKVFQEAQNLRALPLSYRVSDPGRVRTCDHVLNRQ